MSDYKEIHKLLDLIEDLNYTMLTTTTIDGHLHACPMYNELDDEDEFKGSFWFIGSKNSETVKDIQSRPFVNLSFTDPSKGNFVSIHGSAHLITNQAKLDELWDKDYLAHFEGKDDPNIQLIEVKALGAQYWDGDGKLSKIFKLTSAKLTGSKADVIESRTVEFA